MAASLAWLQISTTCSLPKPGTPKDHQLSFKAQRVSFPLKKAVDYRSAGQAILLRPLASGRSTPPELSERVKESIKSAEETCAGDPVSGECAAAWDEVEELSAAASHKRDQLKKSDPLEEYCQDNPATDECRTYDD